MTAGPRWSRSNGRRLVAAPALVPRRAPVIGVLGPTNVDAVAAAADLPVDVYVDTARAVGRLLARRGMSIAIVPDRGVALHATEAYRAAHGPRTIGLLPHSGVCAEGAAEAVRSNAALCDEVRGDFSWFEQHHAIGELSDVLVAIGLSCGTLAEIAWTKWGGRTPVAVLEGTTSGVPPEIVAETDTTIVELAELGTWIEAQLVARQQ